MKLTQTTIEQIAWYLVLLMVVAAVAVGVIVWNLGRKIDINTKATQEQVQCIAEYFTQTDRASLVIPNIDKCNITKVQ